MSKPHIPLYKRPPQKFVKYEEAEFDDGAGNGGIVRIAHFLDKKGKAQTMTAQVTWKFGWYKGITQEEYLNQQ